MDLPVAASDNFPLANQSAERAGVAFVKKANWSFEKKKSIIYEDKAWMNKP